MKYITDHSREDRKKIVQGALILIIQVVLMFILVYSFT